LNICTYAPTQPSLVRMFSPVMSWGAKMCHLLPRVFSPENVRGTLHMFYFWEYIYIYMCVLLRLGFWTFPLSSSFLGKPPCHGNQKCVILLWRVFWIGTWQEQFRYCCLDLTGVYGFSEILFKFIYFPIFFQKITWKGTITHAFSCPM
jgi:hypothetical protein